MDPSANLYYPRKIGLERHLLAELRGWLQVCAGIEVAELEDVDAALRIGGDELGSVDRNETLSPERFLAHLAHPRLDTPDALPATGASILAPVVRAHKLARHQRVVLLLLLLSLDCAPNLQGPRIRLADTGEPLREASTSDYE